MKTNSEANEVTFYDVIAAQQAAMWAPKPKTRACLGCGKQTTSDFRCGACVCKDDPFAAFYPTAPGTP
jgi:hypothetical protein